MARGFYKHLTAALPNSALAQSRLGQHPTCGKCAQELFQGRPLDVASAVSVSNVEFEGSLNKGRRAITTQWQDGKLVTVWPEDMATGKAIESPINVEK